MTVEIICPRCNLTRKIPKEKVPPGIRWATCPRCRERFEFVPPPPEFGFERTEAAAGGGRGPSPWENRAEAGALSGITRTVRLVLFSPRKFFRAVAFEGGMREPLAFGLLTGTLGTMAIIFWEFLQGGQEFFLGGWKLLEGVEPVVKFWGFMVLAPLFVAMNLYITSVVVHLLLLLVRGGKHGFEATFRVVSYSQASQIWGFVPFAGGALAGIWLVVVQIIGLREIHGISYLKIIFAILIPFLFLLFLLGSALTSLLVLLN